MPLFSFEERFKEISMDEKISMRKFFDHAIKKDQLGHILLFDSKPMCLTSVVLKDRHKTFNDLLCLKGWYAFKRNEVYFPHPNFLIIEENFKSGSLEVIHIYFINKRALKKCLHTYSAIFKENLDEDFSEEDFLSKIETKRKITSEIKNNQLLLGIMLGYGLESSAVYKEKHLINTNRDIPVRSETYYDIRSKSLKKNKITPVNFMGNPNSPEVKKLIGIYDLELEEILKQYNRKNNSLMFALEYLCTDI